MDKDYKGFTFEERVCVFWEKVDRSAGHDGCWIWTGAVTSKWNYGCFQTGQNRVLGAHKVAWLLTNGDTNGLCVLHRCDNRVCVNPAHLFLGSKQDNWDDMDAKGRYIGRGRPVSMRSSRRNWLSSCAAELRPAPTTANWPASLGTR